MENLQVQKISTAQAAQSLARAGVADPRHVNTPADIAAYGQCLQFQTGQGACTFVMREERGVLWIDGAASEGGTGHTGTGLELAEATAQVAGCHAVAFETDRPGLVKLAQRQGYKVTGYILEKAVQP